MGVFIIPHNIVATGLLLCYTINNMRKDPFIIGKYYHIYNRGTDKRIIFMDKYDLWRFLQSMEEFNTIEPIGSIYENRYKKKNKNKDNILDELGNPIAKLVDIIVYSLNPNHYHFILSPLVENGIEKFMQKLGTGFTQYFNQKYERSGVLFQGKYKSILINSDVYLLYLSAYINLNNEIHFSGHSETKIDKNKLFYTSSWDEYIGKSKRNFCNKSIILDRYGDKIEDYKKEALDVMEGIVNKRYNKDLNSSLIEDLFIEEV